VKLLAWLRLRPHGRVFGHEPQPVWEHAGALSHAGRMSPGRLRMGTMTHCGRAGGSRPQNGEARRPSCSGCPTAGMLPRMAYDEDYAASIARSYDGDYALLRDPVGDRQFYAQLARDAGGPVLELGCGTGRVLLPIAREGIECVGLDLSPAMLDVFRAKVPPANLSLVQASLTDFDLGGRRFRLVFAAFRVFQHLLTIQEQLAALACARRHLAPGGLFVFDVFAPKLSRIELPEEPETQDVAVRDGDDVVRRFVAVWRDQAAQVQRVRLRHERWRAGAKLSEETAEIRMRWFFRYEVEHLLARAGFEPIAFYGGFDRRPYDGTGEIVAMARSHE